MRASLRARVALGVACLVAVGCQSRPKDSAARRNASRVPTATEFPRSDSAVIASAISAAPPGIAAAASVMVVRTMRIVRRGTNSWTCMPDNPSTPGNMPMCSDPASIEWANAFRARQAPPPGRPLGISYLLQGTWFPSVSDPYVKPAPGMAGVSTGPMLMIVNVPRAALAGYPHDASDPDKPFVMYAGTPYEHLMVPVGSP